MYGAAAFQSAKRSVSASSTRGTMHRGDMCHWAEVGSRAWGIVVVFYGPIDGAIFAAVHRCHQHGEKLLRTTEEALVGMRVAIGPMTYFEHEDRAMTPYLSAAV